MDITQDIILDLLPAYFSGEASASTRALVEDFLAGDPAFAERVRRDWAQPLTANATSTAPVTPDTEMRSLRRTRRLLTLLRWLFALAMTLTVLPFSLVISLGNGRPTELHFLIRDYPGALLPVLAAGLVCWLVYAKVRRWLRVERRTGS